MTKIKAQTLKGFRDFLPEEMAIRQKVIDTLREVFESYGYEPLETPSLEYAETLLGKSGEEADKMVYTFKDKGKRDIGLIYDLTVPASKVLALYSQKINLPFKRYQIQRIWRAEKPQKGRYREVLQCDVDSFGTSSPLADAEIVAITYDCLKKLNFKKFWILINSRELLNCVLKEAGVEEKEGLIYLQTLDKWKKIGKNSVKKELVKKGAPNKMIDNIIETIEQLRKIKKLESYEKEGILPSTFLETFETPLNKLKNLFILAMKLGVPRDSLVFDSTLARGLDYYTGPIFETVVEKPKIGSITGGGRFDKLVSDLGGPDIPATGISIGLDRICDVINEKNLMPELSPTPTKVLVTIFSPEYLEKSIELVTKLRKVKINAELYLDPEAKLDKQLKYADKKGIPFVIILGPEEIKKNVITLRDMKAKTQEQLGFKQLLEKLS